MTEGSLLIAGTLLDPRRQVIRRGGREIPISAREAEVMAYLAARMGEVVSRDDLLREVWGSVAMQTRAVDNLILRLRRKLGDSAAHPVSLYTVRGEGYRLEAEIVEGAAGRLAPIDGAAMGPDRVIEVVGSGATELVDGWIRSRRRAWRAIFRVSPPPSGTLRDLVSLLAAVIGCEATADRIGAALAALGPVVVAFTSARPAAEALRMLLPGWRARAPEARWVVATARGIGLPDAVELSIPDPDDRAPPAAAARTPRLPSLFGRDREIACLEEAWRAGRRVLSVVGPAGSGKSALLAALEHGRAPATSRWCRVDLAGEVPLDLALAEAIGAGPAGDTPDERRRSLERAVAAMGEAWLVLDGAEARLDEVEELVIALTMAAPDLRVGLTSRIRPRNLGDTRVVLGPLDDDPACDLLEAGGGGSGWAREDLLRLARSLDGLPLALELVAPRIGALPPSALLPVVTRSLAPLADRGRSVRGALATAWAHLADEERRVLARLSVLEAPFDLAAAEAATGLEEGPLLDALQRLLEASMLARRALGDDFDQLRTTRLFAREHLGSEAPVVGRRVALHFAECVLRWLDQLEGPAARQAIDGLESALPHLRWVVRSAEEPALRVAARLGIAAWYRFRGSAEHRRTVLEEALADVPPGEAELAARTLLELASDASSRCAWDDLARYADRAHDAAVRARRDDFAVCALLRRNTAEARTDRSRADARYREILALAEDDPLLRAEVLVEWADFAAEDPEPLLREAWRLARRAGGWRSASRIGVSLGRCLRHAGQRVEAERVFRATLEMVQQLGWVLFEEGVASLLGDLAMATGNLSEAARHLRAAADLGARHGHVSLVVFSLANVGAIELALGRPEAADELLGQALALQDEVPGHPAWALVWLYRGAARALLGSAYEADLALRRAAAVGSAEATYARCRPLAEAICGLCADPGTAPAGRSALRGFERQAQSAGAGDADAQMFATVLRAALERLDPAPVTAPGT